MNVTNEQKKILLDWMKLHPEVARGRIRQKGESKSKMKQLLEDMATTINQTTMANKGPIKSSSEWFKTWKDWKMYVLKKETKRRSHQLGTGGGSPMKIDMSPLEEELLDFLTPEAAGLENISQGGLYLDQHASCSQEDVLPYPDNLNDLDTILIQEPQSNKAYYKDYLPPHKKLRTSNQALNKESEVKSMSVEMVNLQKEKIQLKKEELYIQRRCLEVQQSTLTELRQMRRAMDIFVASPTNENDVA